MAMSAITSTDYSSTVETSIIDKISRSSQTQGITETNDSPRSHVSSEESASTDTGGSLDDTDNISSDGAEVVVNGDSDAASSDQVSVCLVYSVAFMLWVRTAVGNRCPVSRTSTRPDADLPGCSEIVSESKSCERVVPWWSCANIEDEKIERAARSILNKLTTEKFAALYEQLATVGLRTPEHITIVIQEIFEQATVQHKFIQMYADLCERLEQDPRIVQAAEADGKPNTFRQLLLSQCQTAFEQFLEPQTPVSACGQHDEVRALRKLRVLGNVKLVGHLMVRGLLNSKLLCSCAEELFRGGEDSPYALESLAALLTVTGPTFDTPSFKRRSRLDAIFVRVGEVVSDKRVPSRVRFILDDVLDSRAAMWSQDQTVEQEPTPTSDGLLATFQWPAAAVCSFRVRSALASENTEVQTTPFYDSGGTFDQAALHWELSGMIKELGQDRNVSAAVGKVRAQHVPEELQAKVFADILTRAVEETRGPFRRSAFAFAACLAVVAGPQSAFVRSECLNGTRVFFQEIYEELCADIPRLDVIVAREMVPCLQTVFPDVEIMSYWPELLRP